MFDSRAARVLFTVLVIGFLLLFIWAAWRTIIAFIFGIFFAYLLEAPVEKLTPFLRGSRKLSIAVVYLGLIGIIALVLALAAPRIMSEAERLSSQLPELTQKLATGQIAYTFGNKQGWSYETQARLQKFLADHREQILSTFQAMATNAIRTLKDLWWLVLVPILAVFFLVQGPDYRRRIITAVERRQDRRLVAGMVSDINNMLGHFIRAQLALSALAMLVLTVAFLALGVPYSFAVGPAAGALEFIPVVGPLIGGALVLAVSFLSGYSHLILLIIVLLLWRGLQDYVTSPKVMGSRLEMNSLTILFGVLTGAEVGGVIGVFLSIPVMAAVRILWRAWVNYREMRENEPGPGVGIRPTISRLK